MNKFNSKTELIEHLKDLVDCKYLTENWFTVKGSTKTRMTKFYTISFETFEDKTKEGGSKA